VRALSHWHHLMLAPGTFLWTDPYGLHYLRTPDATTSLG